ncbi:hypothetical protein JB92DRAFT_3102126 [Gautieria morchelliformis]|nr:hypothetical protein JB92DRAFT_3102126 [Gautieria morchelliformis]
MVETKGFQWFRYPQSLLPRVEFTILKPTSTRENQHDAMDANLQVAQDNRAGGPDVVLVHALVVANVKAGRSSQLEPGQSSRLSASNEQLQGCDGEMVRLRPALSYEMESIEATQALTWPLEMAEVLWTVKNIKGSLMSAMEGLPEERLLAAGIDEVDKQLLLQWLGRVR